MKRMVFFALVVLTTTCYFSGCNSATDEHAGHDHGTDGAEQSDDAAGDGHATEGPNGGHVLILGNHAAHAELLHDDAAEKVTVWLTDHDGAMIEAGDNLDLQIFVDGKFVDFEIPGTSPGVYESDSTELGEALGSSVHLQGRLRAMIAGQEAVGTIDIDDHDHDHAAEAAAEPGAEEDAHVHAEDDAHNHDAEDGHVH